MLTTLWSVLRYGAWVVVALFVIMTLGVWGATLRTFGPSCLRHCPRMLRLSFRAGPIRELFVAILLPLLAMGLMEIYGPAARYLAPFPVSALALIGLLCLTLFPVPPVAVVFSSSTDKQLRWALSLKRFTAGRRVISLLDTGFLAVKARVSDAWLITLLRSGSLTDVLRTSNPNRWQAVVRELIEISPIVIVDTRVCTRALLFEASAMLTSEYAYKAIFIRADDGTSPVLERLLSEGSISADFRAHVVKEGELGELLQRLLVSRNTLPKPGTAAAATIGQSISRDARGRRPAHDLVSIPKSCSGPTATPGTKLSSSLTPAWRWSARAGVVYLVTSTIWVLWLTLSIPLNTFSKRAVLLWSLLLLEAVGCGVYFFMARSLKNVDLRGGSLFVSDKSTECEIPISQISHVTGPDWTSLRRTTIHLHEPSGFGKQIVFAGRLFSAGKLTRNLRQLVLRQEGPGGRE
jgi:hypothetical protein